MNRQELIKEAHSDLKSKGIVINHKQSKEIFDIVLNVISDNIVKGKTLTITDFGTFESSLREFRNPNNGKKLERFSIKFKASTTLKKNINGKIKSK